MKAVKGGNAFDYSFFTFLGIWGEAKGQHPIHRRPYNSKLMADGVPGIVVNR